MIGLGCMRLSAARTRAAAHAVSVIHAALDAGATLLDTADAYCLDEHDVGHNERLVAHALATWSGDGSTIEVATKGGLLRPGGRWAADGRARHLRAACEASCHALGVDRIQLYQLHAVDPRTPIETSVRALSALQSEGRIQRIGLCNVTVGQIKAARRIADIAAVQVSLGVLDDENLRNGVTEYCLEHGIRLIAYRPLGGERNQRIARDTVLLAIGKRHDATPHEVALASLMDLGPHVVPIPGATREASARSLARALAVQLTDSDRAALDDRFPAGRLLRLPRSARRARDDAEGDVVLVMGMPAAGKSSVARELAECGYQRLNRDTQGGRLADLVQHLEAGLASGQRRWVLDNTYATRGSRNEVIECAWRHGVPARCIWLTTSTPDAQINAVTRLIEAHGRLPGPEELRALGKRDHRFFGPDAQFRYERTFEPPVFDEGFTAVEERAFVRRLRDGFERRALLLEYDGVLCESRQGAPAMLDPDDIVIPPARRATLAGYHARGWVILSQAWRPQVGAGKMTGEAVERCIDRTRDLLGVEIDIAWCPHVAGPPICWCRKPLPGLMLEFAFRYRLDLQQCIAVGRSPADRTLAERLGMIYREHQAFFAGGID